MPQYLLKEDLKCLPSPPQNWIWVKLDSIGHLLCGQSPSISQVNFEGKGNLYVTGPEQWNGQEIKQTKWTEYPTRIAPFNSIFITVKGAGVGKLFPGTHCVIGRDIYAFCPDQTMNFKFVFYSLLYGINKVILNVLFFDNREASPNHWSKEVWYYDYRTNVHHTLKKKTMQFKDLKDFIQCYNPQNRQLRKESWDSEKNPDGRWRKFSYDELIARDKTSLDIFWLKDKSLTDLDNLPDPDILANEIIENLEAALVNFRNVARALEV